MTIPFRRAGCVSSLGAAAWAAGSQVPPPRLAAPPAIPVGLLGFRREVPRIPLSTSHSHRLLPSAAPSLDVPSSCPAFSHSPRLQVGAAHCRWAAFVPNAQISSVHSDTFRPIGRGMGLSQRWVRPDGREYPTVLEVEMGCDRNHIVANCTACKIARSVNR